MTVRDFAESQGLVRLRKGRRALNHAKYLMIAGASRSEAEPKAREAAKVLRSAMDWLEGSQQFEAAHQELDDAGRYLRQSFGCSVTFRDGEYWRDCPVDLAHDRIGLSIGAVIRESACSICGRDPRECPHVTGRKYDGKDCTRVVEDVELIEVSIVNQPAQPDARVQSMGIRTSDLRDVLGEEFRPGVLLSCNLCLSDCRGLNYGNLPLPSKQRRGSVAWVEAADQ